MIKQWSVEPEWQEPFLEALRARGATPRERDRALGEVDDACLRQNTSARELFGDPSVYGKDYPVSHSTTSVMDSREAGLSRVRAIVLALAGLVGMFFALLGWSGKVEHLHRVWGADPTIWFVLGLIIAIAAAIGDMVLGAKADFSQGRSGAGATVMNRLLPWIIVALTLVGMLIISLRH